MPAAEQGPRDERRAREAMVAGAAYTLAAVGVQLAAVLLLTRRDWLRQQWLRYRWHVLREWRGALERQLLAELRRDLSRMDHEGIPGHGD